MLIESSNAAIFSLRHSAHPLVQTPNQAHKSGFSVVIILTLLKMKISKVRHC